MGGRGSSGGGGKGRSGGGSVTAGAATQAVQIKERYNGISSKSARELFNAPIGTVIEISAHESGSYIGEYTKTTTGWVGSQRYRSNYVKPSDVRTENGFVLQIEGRDVRKRNK